MRNVDILIIGGGPAGLAAAVSAYEAGARDILILEREENLGGILKQCIHNGFGLHTFKEELTGPEYAQRYIDKVLEYGIPSQCDTMVIDITPDKVVTAVSRGAGLEHFKAKSVILAMGCRERPRGSLATPGWRCSGIYTAGTAQKFTNLKGLMPGRRVLILGSGDIGLIMARRMTFLGAKVLACVELMPFSAGLKRNIVQCLDDYDIPLLLSHTVTDIAGRERLEGVTVAEVDPKTLKPIPGTEEYYECDTLLLSVGLIPENELSTMAGVKISPATNGAEVNENLQTSVDGIFSCGNVLHVHDLVDFVSEESAKAGANAYKYVQGQLAKEEETLEVVNGFGVSGAVPQHISKKLDEPITIMFRPRGVYKDAKVCIDVGDVQAAEKKSRILTPGEMVTLKFTPEYLQKNANADKITVRVEAQQS
ncbi:FAD-dependent oxidoreductase [Clostridium sp. KNHs216]|uniref:NAD(P)/FAD-dependent oxidoreductase n=1 Tax=Eubacteriales TaxID=186802 RepID=UPI0011528EB3|nr:FAD-dependent oxidoreductase [Clostridium sp. KNHs216]MBE6830677.1 FAD-binding protein [Oscillospiraceae bacterium]